MTALSTAGGELARISAIVPIKSTDQAKGRLAAVLGPRRQLFAQDLALHTVETLMTSQIFSSVLVVTADEPISEACKATGAVILFDKGSGLNLACSQGLHYAALQRADLACIIHSDLPMLKVATLEAIVGEYLEVRAQHGVEAIGLVRCKDGTGTNVILLDPNASFTLHFGPGSFASHLLEAGPRGHELHGLEATFDIDTAADLDQLLHLQCIPKRFQSYAKPPDVNHLK